MYELPDDPRIRFLEQTGLPPWEAELPETRCPVCGYEAETYVLDMAGEIVRCGMCAREVDAVEYERERRQEGRDDVDYHDS